MPDDVVDQLEAYDVERGRIDELEPRFRQKLNALLGQLRERGWAARVAIGPRTVSEQIDLFGKRRTTLLRGSHLCRRAADLSLYPVGIPPTEHRFWDVKDELAVDLGLDVVDYEPETMKFVDRPHVQSTRCSTADWDRLGLSPVGTWVGELNGEELTLTFARDDRDRLRLSADGSNIDDFTRQRGEGAAKIRRDEITFNLDGRAVSGEFSALENDSGVRRPDYRRLRLDVGGERVILQRSR